MHNKLTCQFGIDKGNVEWRKMEVHPHSTCQFFYPLICRKVVATGCKQQPKGGILNAENGYGQHSNNSDDTEEHPAQHLKVLSECHHLIILIAHVLAWQYRLY